ncbi:unnamed protein product, partial [Staurois parvus]
KGAASFWDLLRVPEAVNLRYPLTPSSAPKRSTVFGHPLYYVRSLWSSPVLCLQSLVISCSTSTLSGHLLYCVRSLWSSPVACPQSLVISCTMSAVSGHLL